MDIYGREITKETSDGFDHYITGGMTKSFPEGTPEAAVLDSFAGNAPEGYTPPAPSKEQLENELSSIVSRAKEIIATLEE